MAAARKKAQLELVIPLSRARLNQTRRALEDSIEEYAKVYGAFCMHKARRELTDSAWDVIHNAINDFERAVEESVKEAADAPPTT